MENNVLKAPSVPILINETLLVYWQGHRALTRRVIEAFPEKELFTYSVGGMRPFAVLAMEMIDLAGPGMYGLITDEWDDYDELPHHNSEGIPDTKQELLDLWDEITEVLNKLWPELDNIDLDKRIVAFGQFEDSVRDTLLYYIDNDIHHRGQGYVYLRSLGIEPPFFWER
ncbi:MAG: damage-inducible protein DinB [Flavobacterium sp. MedPE-SWcel]|uniref:DinB family protein n=1 Tax=uncultured Flavobacterium sp. TaxID=165435 RepID=UPI0009230EE1|nr:DinB family protein [uncultured Flavobacterium sp.]OIQ19278.1 MAG: damage-inducible protein DinB [Flavobacterium sp. MedPE-SWcel]